MNSVRPLVVVGAGGFGRETLDVVVAVNNSRGDGFELLGVLDDRPSLENLARLDAVGVPYLGAAGAWLEGTRTAAYVIGIGQPSVRRRVAEGFDAHGDLPATLIHPSAVIGSASTVGPGTVVCGGVQISTNVHLGRHVHLNPNATVGHDSVLEDYVSVNPAATVSGECRIRTGVLLGAASVVLQGLTVGSESVVGAAACAVRDVADGVTVKGVPAR